jgi:hypothetical protein
MRQEVRVEQSARRMTRASSVAIDDNGIRGLWFGNGAFGIAPWPAVVTVAEESMVDPFI